MKTYALMPILAVLIIVDGAYAQETLISDRCFPVKSASDRLRTNNLKPDRRDTVDTFLEAYFVDAKTRRSPMSLYLKHDEMRDDFVVSESGKVEDFHTKVMGAHNEASICGPTRKDGKIGLGISTSVRFKNRSGTHTITEISDGLKDGKSHFQKNLGGVQAMLVPKMTHAAIIYDVPDTTADVSAIAKGESVPVTLEPYGEMWVIDLETLKDSHVETITIGGGFYELFPVPSIKKMKSLGIN